jgi:putative DNA primase/helicase
MLLMEENKESVGQSSILEEARGYINRGYSVIPIKNGEKRPSIDWEVYQDRLPSENELCCWFENTKNQIGIVTGCVSGGLFILDFDGENWPESFNECLERYPEFVDSVIVQTGSGKAHVYGTCSHMPKDLNRKIKKCYDVEGRIISQVELRANDHQSLCPPSFHPSGGRYSFVNDAKSPVAINLERLNEILTWMNEGQKVNPIPNTSTCGPPFEAELTPTQKASLARFYASRFASQCRKGAGRNDTGFKLALDLYYLGLSKDEAQEFMELFRQWVPQNKSVDHPYTLEEVLGNLDSAYSGRYPQKPPWIPQGFFQIDPKTGELMEEGEVTKEVVHMLVNYHLTDAGNAESFVALNKSRFCYIFEKEGWYRFDGVRWDEEVFESQEAMLSLIRTRAKYGQTIEDDKQRKKYLSWCLASESSGKIKAALSLARIWLSRRFEEFDTDSYLFVCKNGVVNLRTGEFVRDPQRGLFLKSSWIEYDLEARCLRWLQFLDEIFKSDHEMIGFIQRAVGYTLTGDVREDCLFILEGKGSNGKTVLLSILLLLLGEYGLGIPSKTLQELGQPGSASPEIVRMAGARLVRAIEMKEHARLNVERIKALTGRDRITARDLYERPIEFDPTHKIWLGVNHLPRIEEDDDGTWRRIRRIPFEVQFVEPDEVKEGDLVKDKELTEKLKAELPGILNWAIQGCVEWQQGGLRDPDKVRAATRSYRVESDTLGRFLEQETVREESEEVRASELYEAYKSWCDSEGEKSMTQTMFGKRLGERGYVKRPKPHITYQGLRLLNPSLLNRDERLEKFKEMYRKTKEDPEQIMSD